MAGVPPIIGRSQDFWSDPNDNSWITQAITGLPQLASDAWGGINDLGEQWFGGGPTDFSGQVETARQYAEDTADQYVDMARHPVGYARDNPSATLASLIGLTAGGAGLAGRALGHGARIGSNYIPHDRTPDAPDAPSRAGGITSRLSNAEEAAAQDDFARTLQRLIDEERAGTAPPRERIKGTDPRVRGVTDRIGRGTRRLLDDESGEVQIRRPDPAGRAGEWFDEQVRAYQKNRQPEAGEIEDMSPEARNIRDMLEQSGWSEEPRQAPTMGPRAAADLERAIAARARTRALMEGEMDQGHATRMNAQGGAGVTSIRQGRRIGGESQQWAPFDRDVEAPGSKPRPRGPNKNLNPDVNDILDPRVREAEGAASGGPAEPGGNVAEGYSGGIRDVLANEGPRPTLEDLFEHETDIGNIESIRRTGVESRWDPAEEGRKFVSARRRNPKGGEPPEGRARVIFRTSQSPIERPGLSAVKFRETIRPEDIVDIIQAKKSTMGNLVEDVRRSGRELDPEFETKPKPSPSPPRRSKAPKKAPVPVPKNTSASVDAVTRARNQQR